MALKLILGILVGGGLGFAYYHFVGCSTGSCPLTGNPYVTTIFGGMLGGMFAGAFRQTQPH